MTKRQELIKEVAKSSGISSEKAKSALDRVLVFVEERLGKSESSLFSDLQEPTEAASQSSGPKGIKFRPYTPKIELDYDREEVDQYLDPFNEAILARVDETIKYANKVYDKTNEFVDNALAEIEDLSTWLKSLSI